MAVGPFQLNTAAVPLFRALSAQMTQFYGLAQQVLLPLITAWLVQRVLEWLEERTRQVGRRHRGAVQGRR